MTSIVLGGTRGDSTWRDELISRMVKREVPADFFTHLCGPMEWTPDMQMKQIAMIKMADLVVYYLGPEGERQTCSPYALLEVLMGMNYMPTRSVIVFDNAAFPSTCQAEMEAVVRHARWRFMTVKTFTTLDALEEWMVAKFGW